jgi:hypothetical protein
MVLNVGRTQLIGIAVVLALFFVAEFAMHGFDGPPPEQAQAQSR